MRTELNKELNGQLLTLADQLQRKADALRLSVPKEADSFNATILGPGGHDLDFIDTARGSRSSGTAADRIGQLLGPAGAKAAALASGQQPLFDAKGNPTTSITEIGTLLASLTGARQNVREATPAAREAMARILDKLEAQLDKLTARLSENRGIQAERSAALTDAQIAAAQNLGPVRALQTQVDEAKAWASKQAQTSLSLSADPEVVAKDWRQRRKAVLDKEAELQLAATKLGSDPVVAAFAQKNGLTGDQITKALAEGVVTGIQGAIARVGDG